MKKFFTLFLISFQVFAQNPTFESFKKYPFPMELTTSKTGSKIAWAMDEQGKRNIYVAYGPEFKALKLTNFQEDDGQEITSLSISDDGKWVIFARGGDHGSNWDDALPVNPSADAKPFTVKIGAIPFNGGTVNYATDGDFPLISSNNKTVAFIKGGQVWAASIDSLAKAKNSFTTRGSITEMEWSPDGKSLLFASDRGDHSIIGIFTNEKTPIKWITPSFSHDSSPRWSPDGGKIVFVRTPGTGGSPDPLLTKKHNPWSIFIADVATNTSKLLWKAPKTLRGSEPTTHGGTNLHWAANDKIVYLSYQDGWPHLYSISAMGGKEILLTPGNFMCEHIKLSADKRFLTFSANAGNDKLDIERRHAAMVSVDKPDMQVLTNGNGNEWTPILINNSNTVAFISSNLQQSPLPAVKNLVGLNNIQLIGEELIPTDFPKNSLIQPKQVIFTASDGVEVGLVPFGF